MTKPPLSFKLSGNTIYIYDGSAYYPVAFRGYGTWMDIPSYVVKKYPVLDEKFTVTNKQVVEIYATENEKRIGVMEIMDFPLAVSVGSTNPALGKTIPLPATTAPHKPTESTINKVAASFDTKLKEANVVCVVYTDRIDVYSHSTKIATMKKTHGYYDPANVQFLGESCRIYAAVYSGELTIRLTGPNYASFNLVCTQGKPAPATTEKLALLKTLGSVSFFKDEDDEVFMMEGEKKITSGSVELMAECFTISGYNTASLSTGEVLALLDSSVIYYEDPIGQIEKAKSDELKLKDFMKKLGEDIKAAIGDAKEPQEIYKRVAFFAIEQMEKKTIHALKRKIKRMFAGNFFKKQAEAKAQVPPPEDDDIYTELELAEFRSKYGIDV